VSFRLSAVGVIVGQGVVSSGCTLGEMCVVYVVC